MDVIESAEETPLKHLLLGKDYIVEADAKNKKKQRFLTSRDRNGVISLNINPQVFDLIYFYLQSGTIEKNSKIFRQFIDQLEYYAGHYMIKGLAHKIGEYKKLVADYDRLYVTCCAEDGGNFSEFYCDLCNEHVDGNQIKHIHNFHNLTIVEHIPGDRQYRLGSLIVKKQMPSLFD